MGGGSGGHVTPIVAVLKQIDEQQQGDVEVRVWSDASFYRRTNEAVSGYDASIIVQKIASGKVRRFYGVPLWRHLLRVRTIVLPNIIDVFRMVGGVVQSVIRMLFWRPDVVFCKGGFVSVPVGVAARILSIPVVLHDSDAHPGLANSILAKWAMKIGTGASLDHYRYPVEKARYVGIPINAEFRVYNPQERKAFAKKLGFATDRPLIVVTGGGLGAKPINDAVVEILDQLLAVANVMLLSGDYQYEELLEKLEHYKDTSIFQLHPFLAKDMLAALAGADIVVARAGATTLLELSALAKPTVLIPNPNLTGGHQTKNAKVFANKNAVALVEELELAQDSLSLLNALTSLLASEKKRADLSRSIQTFAMPNAARDMADMIIKTAKKKNRRQG